MKYNAKYDKWVTKGGLVYRYDSKKDRLIQCKMSYNKNGYLMVNVTKPKKRPLFVHRLVFETFVDEIPQCYEIDHINTVRDDNRLENLRLVTHKENSNNPLTRKHRSEALKGKTFTDAHRAKIGEALKGNTKRRGKTFSEFGTKFKEHFGITNYDNTSLYNKEHSWYIRHNKVCRWEVEDK